MQYNKDVIYTLKVTGTMIINGNQYYLIENEGIKYKVKMLQFQQKLPVPDKVKCTVYGYDADDTPLFAQHKGEIARELYTIGSTYSFVVRSKSKEQGGHRNYSYGYDVNGIRVFIQGGMGKELTIGRNVRCTVKHINPEGSLYVVPVSQDADTETNFITFDELLANIHAEAMPPCIQLETLRSESGKDPKIQQMLEQYDKREGEWLLSFLHVLLAKREVKITEKDWPGVCGLIGYQRLITEWVLEDSLFLTFYSSSVVQSLREKGEREIFVCEAILKAVELIRTDTADGFLEHIFVKIRTSGYSNADNVILTLAVKKDEIGGTLLLCYENGFVNRVPLKILLQKKRNYVYKNGVNKDSHLIFATIENGEAAVLARTVRQKTEYLKMFPIAKVKVNMDLTLKGTPLFSYDFGKVVAWEVISEVESDMLQKLYNDNLSHQGYSYASEAIIKERELLRIMGWNDARTLASST